MRKPLPEPWRVKVIEKVKLLSREEREKIVKEAVQIWSNDDAQCKCPMTCGELDWEGVWWTTKWGQMSVCECLAAN